MSLKVFEYKNCSTCKKALRFLDVNKINYKAIPIVDKPPTIGDLKKMLGFLKKNEGSIKNLFNTSGVQYRELKIADKLKAGMSEEVSIKLLSGNGKLIKRPFVLGDDFGMVGFKEDNWTKTFKK